jgi:mannose-6-phosphate isomerase-like protein (cupin superfamily)
VDGNVYFVLCGDAEIEIDGQRIALDTDTIVRVGPGARRRVIPGPKEYG